MTWNQFTSRTFLALFVSAIVVLSIRGISLRMVTRQLQVENNNLTEEANRIEMLTEESQRLQTLVYQKWESNRKKIYVIENACNQIRSIDEFPVRSGPFIVSGQHAQEDRWDVTYFVPEGNHTMKVMLKFENETIEESAINSRSWPGHSIKYEETRRRIRI